MALRKSGAAGSKTSARICHAGKAPADRLGGKGRSLQALAHDFPIPDWFALIPVAGDQSDKLVVPDLKAALKRLDGGQGPYAVRSSALDEDGSAHSFAGQLESHLNVTAEDVAAAVESVWASAREQRARSYRQLRGLDGETDLPTVLVQRMVPAEWAGVAFSADPVSGRRDQVVVAGLDGLGEALVSGERSGETVVFAGTDLQGAPVQADPDLRMPLEVARAAAEFAIRAEHLTGRPQDIEWAWAEGQLWLLQSRPVTTLTNLPDPDGAPVLWDNSNIAESYSGVTTPMTFSFARYVYAGVYREFCRLLRVPDAVIRDGHEAFDNLLGLVRGRIYYNLLNWYRCLAMLPGFRFNGPMMEKMMGVDEALPDELMAQVQVPASGRWRRWGDLLRLLSSLSAMGFRLFRLPRDIRRFHVRLDTALAADASSLQRQRPDQLVAHYRDLERQLLARWDAPLVNDFFAMIFHGLLEKLCARWLPNAAEQQLHNELLAGDTAIISTEPATRVAALADQARSAPVLVRALRQDSVPDIRALLNDHPEFKAEVTAYLQRFGDRCVEELKLESRTLNEDPLPLFRAIGTRAAAPERTDISDPGALRRQAEQAVAKHLRGRPLRRWLFQRVLGQARARVRERENLRFERTRLFGRVRQILLELGKRLYALDRLDAPEDVFYLELEEVLGFVEGHATSTDLKGLAALRKTEFAACREGPAPADRFMTRGAVHVGHSYERAMPAADEDMTADLSGTGCCAGVVRGPVRVVTDPRAATLEPGEILVAERTDPGWILLLSAATGVIVEHGSLLSHAAIVTRELGVPSVVAVPGATRLLVTGEWVELNGATGAIRRLAAEESTSDSGQGEPADTTEEKA
ncbi:phosphoenolpyruvate synthase [Natronospirillum operosum]|uniref:Phosphoenolpyruvate synthase n=1 Tax=Natronospirillum operosum TaxID=2759953 RepID=A0A4Z0WIA6_9GAMM|nr:PEP/pyruvate-binding domain-containing protein [Natronospirillum operosum]TGG95506.1 phosphoenolpyruvate synthase [Natronospirillum operosum]